MLKRAKPLPKPRTPDTRIPEEIVEKISDSIVQFEPINGHPYNTNLLQIREVVAPLLLQIQYEKTGGTHNLIGLIRPVSAYTTHYGAELSEPTRVGAYDVMIDDDATAVICVRTEAAHKAKSADRGTYETVRQDTAQFILSVVKDTWVQELKDTETFYTNVAPKALLAHLQAGCTGCHALELLALQNEMQRYHLEVEGIPKYINMLEYAQKQAGPSSRTIANKTLLLFASM